MAQDLTPEERLRDGQWVKAIYFGLPLEICQDPDEPDGVLGRGLGAWAMGPLDWLLPFNGMFLLYDGSYLAALWAWLTVDLRDSEE